MKSPFKNYKDWLLLNYFFVGMLGFSLGLLFIQTLQASIFGLVLMILSLAGVVVASKGVTLLHSRDYKRVED